MRRTGRPRASALVGLTAVLLFSACTGDDGAEDAASVDPSTTTTTAPLPATNRSVPITAESPGVAPGFNVYRPTDLAATGEPLPIIVWANGGCVRFDQTWTVLLERWAAAGFFVIALAALPEEVESPPAGATTEDDQAALIDWADEQNEQEGGPYEGRLDTDRVVAAGNSCGGITSLRLAGQDARVQSVFVLSGSSVGPGASREQAAAVMDLVAVPVGFAVGAPGEDIANPQAVQDYDLLAPGIPGMVASRSSGDHPTVSTDEAIQADVAEIGLNWMDLTLFGSQAAAAALTENGCEVCAPGVWTVTAKHLDKLTKEGLTDQAAVRSRR